METHLRADDRKSAAPRHFLFANRRVVWFPMLTPVRSIDLD
jgi:hypothetical protein